MDFGLTSGNAFYISTPPTITTEIVLYLHLCFDLSARQAMIRKAEEVRVTSWDDVWAHHDTMLFPFVIYPTMSEDQILELVHQRVLIILKNGDNRL